MKNLKRIVFAFLLLMTVSLVAVSCTSDDQMPDESFEKIDKDEVEEDDI